MPAIQVFCLVKIKNLCSCLYPLQLMQITMLLILASDCSGISPVQWCWRVGLAVRAGGTAQTSHIKMLPCCLRIWHLRCFTLPGLLCCTSSLDLYLLGDAESWFEPLVFVVQGLLQALTSLRCHVAPSILTGTDLLDHLQTQARLLPTGCTRCVACLL